MARSHSFWMIIDGTVPTSFRGREREDLLPTLNQLLRTQPNVAIVWFERGRTWNSRLEAREALERQRDAPRERKQNWRPGGAHVDPRDKYKVSRDEKRARFKKRAVFDRQSSEGSGPPSESTPPRGDKPFSDQPLSKRPPRPFGDGARRTKPFGFGRPKSPGAGRKLGTESSWSRPPKRSGPGGPKGPRGSRGPKR